jgi:TonB family protein
MRYVLAVLLLCLGACASKAPHYSINGAPPVSQVEASERHAEDAASKHLEQGPRGKKLDTPLKIVYNPMPPYPDQLRRAHVTGDVRVMFTVGADGRVAKAKVLGVAPAPLVELSLQAIRQWRFEPPVSGGQPTEINVLQGFNFRLED